MAALSRWMFLALTWLAGVSPAATVTEGEAASGLKQALLQGAEAAVAQLGRTDGFLGNPKVKIPLPDTLRRVEGLMRTMGMGRQADELVVAMNRAAEEAVPQARTLLVDAVKKMSVRDAHAILTGGDDAATQYFRRATSDELTARFLPIVQRATAKVKLAERYNALAARGQSFGLVDAKQARIEHYVTGKALDGLYLMIAEKERAIRRDPVGEATGLARKVFGSLK